MTNDSACCTGKLRENGWRQGAVLPEALVQQLINDLQIPYVPIVPSNMKWPWLHPLVTLYSHWRHRKDKLKTLHPSNDRWVVLTQDCDLLQLELEKEPYVEILKIKQADPQKDGASQWLKSPRQLSFRESRDSKKSTLWVARVHDLVRIDRTYLAEHEPDRERSLETVTVEELKKWVARRYVRAAFPDVFNARTESAVKALESKSSDLFKKHELLTGIYLAVPDVELGDSDPYEISMIGVIRTEDHNDSHLRDQATELLEEIESQLDKCEGIEISEALLLPEQSMNLDLLRKYQRWDFDSMSARTLKSADDFSAANFPPIT